MQALSALPTRNLALRTLGYSLALALLSQAAQAGANLVMGGQAPAGPGLLLLDLLGKSVWSAFVCEVLALVSIFGRGRWALVLGLAAAGLVAAAAGVLLGEWIKAQVAAALALAGTLSGPAAVQLAWERGRRYLVLGFSLALAKISKRQGVAVWTLAGAAAGVAGMAMTLTSGVATGQAGLLALDIVFPVGCALVVWSAEHLYTRSRLGRAHLALQAETKRRVR